MKNKMIRILPAIFLSLSLCLSGALPALAEDDVQADAPQQNTSQADALQQNTSQADTSQENTLQADTSQENTPQADAPQENTSQADAPQENTSQDAPYARGTATETGFQSEWLNLQFTPPAYMTMSSEEELQSMIQYGQNTIQQNSPAAENTVLPETVYEMMAASSAGFPNVSLIVEASPQEASTPDQYFDALKQLLDAAQLGYQYGEALSDAAVAGQDFRVLTASVTMNGYQVFQKYFTRKQADRFVSVVLSYTEDTAAQADEVLASFTVLHTPESPEGSADGTQDQPAQ